MTVPLDRSGGVPGQVSLLVKRLPAQRRGGATRPPLVALAGGPGQSATRLFDDVWLFIVDEVNATRDIIVFDQRGTGSSGLLRCPLLERAPVTRLRPTVGVCARSLGARRAFYTSRDSADDMEALRAQLGTERIAVYGTSYGTKVALGYAQRYPTRVERLVLDSVVELDGPDAFTRDSMQGVPRVLRALCRRDCAWTPDPVADVAALVARIARRGPLRARLPDARGRPRAGRVTRLDLLDILIAGDFDASLRAAVPGAVRSALRADAAPLLRMRARAHTLDFAPVPPALLSSAANAATLCEEVRLPWARTTPPDPAQREAEAEAVALSIPDVAFAPFDRATALASYTLDACALWPHTPLAPSFGSGPVPDVPVLLVAGEDDLRTPVENARRTAALFPHSKLLVVPQTGHAAIQLFGCARAALTRFLTGRSVAARCPAGRRRFRPTPPAPVRLAEVRRLRGTTGPRGRTLAAVEHTLADVEDDLLARLRVGDSSETARAGGLRGGHYRYTRAGALELHALSFVPGVTLTGRIEFFILPKGQRGRVRVGGWAGPHGVLRIRGNHVSGRLGGRRVRASFGASRDTRRDSTAFRAVGARYAPLP
jgi:pimeloyl-ACP methyl ester carboxylesterase